MSADQAQEQNNKLVKIDGSPTDFFNNPLTLMKWLASGHHIDELFSNLHGD